MKLKGFILKQISLKINVCVTKNNLFPDRVNHNFKLYACKNVFSSNSI